tara:strand:- start:12176 stop:13399 length:1224 start_codon:yes stop_codon:yes gene_type:complete
MMKNWIFSVFILAGLIGCSEKEKNLSEGLWLAELQLMDYQKLPFNFNLERKEDGNFIAKIFNADEIIYTDEIKISNDSILFRMPVFEGYLKGTFTANEIKGMFRIESLDRDVPFIATYGISDRFNSDLPSEYFVSGIWETYFSPGTLDEYVGKGIFVQNDNRVTGTFRTTTGDYRFLEGLVTGDSLKLSAFDGAHAFLFKAKITDTTLNGIFYSGNHFKEPFIAKRNEVFELPDEDSLTYLKKGYSQFSFSFPDTTGKIISLTDKQFQNKPVIIQLMGTWCPNCLDETKFLVDFIQNHKNLDIAVVALAFEYAKTEELAIKSIKRLKDRVGVDYPILLAQFGTSDKQKAQEKLPMLNHVLSYPTTIVIDKNGVVRKIKTGFNGPATGDKFLKFKKEFSLFVTELANE